MPFSRLSACAFSLLALLASHRALFGQEPSLVIPPVTSLEPVVATTDNRVTELKETYQTKVRELTKKLTADLKNLGEAEVPSYVDSIEKTTDKWTFSGSLPAIANHSVRINPSDVAETETWHHYVENPPLAPRTVIVIADKAMRDQFDDEEIAFKLQRISLVPLDATDGKWYWEATYKVSQGHRQKTVAVAIRMDGRVLTKFSTKKDSANKAD